METRCKIHLRMPLPLPRPLPRPGIPLPGPPWPSGPSDFGFLTVSSTDSTRQAASVAAVSALIFTSAGSQTKLAYVSTTPPALQDAALMTSQKRTLMAHNHHQRHHAHGQHQQNDAHRTCPTMTLNSAPTRCTCSPSEPTCIDIYPKVYAISSLGCVLLPQLIEYIGGIEPSIITQLAGNDLQCLCIGIDEQLRLASNCPSMIPQKSASGRQLKTQKSVCRLILLGLDTGHFQDLLSKQ